MTHRVIDLIAALLIVGGLPATALAEERSARALVRLEGRVAPSLKGEWDSGLYRIQSNLVGAQHWRLSTQGETHKVLRLEGVQAGTVQPRGFLEVASPR